MKEKEGMQEKIKCALESNDEVEIARGRTFGMCSGWNKNLTVFFYVTVKLKKNNLQSLLRKQIQEAPDVFRALTENRDRTCTLFVFGFVVSGGERELGRVCWFPYRWLG